jgi:squalene-hopene/tetraprenyl-beta-curcumene cyclase
VKLPDGTFEIPSYASITYAGLMSLLHANLKKDDPRVKGAYGWIEKNYTLEENRGLGGRANPQGAKQGLYYYYHTFAKALAAWGEPEIKAADGTKHRWADELVTRLGELQKPEGFWVNEVKRWWEDDPTLCTVYALVAIDTAYPYLEGAEKPAAPEQPASAEKKAEGDGGGEK